ncbi:DNA processing protein DprA [Echinicola pacifica]|uniref:DNA processing protein DprA n=1 Tax=Echinicola pacifica TaxID=346377 RepID=A0A918Q3W2_9BACT|nr:DNA-processing protein DprA [Echinicola pacifica]GGZ30864.1 DNA processing protein DprA [Echinicola pacifica]
MQKNNDQFLLYSLALSLIPQLGSQGIKNIISYCGGPGEFFRMPAGKAAKIPGIGPKLLAERKHEEKLVQKASLILEECRKHAIRLHSYLDADYPERLKSFADSPIIFYSKGNIDLNSSRTVGIVGTRNASEYGKTITRKIVEELSPYGPTIISGLAYGVDIAAHRAALEYELPTIAVLGNSLEGIYPAAHKVTAMSLCEQGGLISEYPIGTVMNPNNFPARNRIIAALSDALIVVEAAKKGGALITAEIAYSYNREVFAVPGNLQNIYSEGCNNLIRGMKAAIYTGSRDIKEALSWTEANEEPIKQSLDLSQFSEPEQQLLTLIKENTTIQIDQLGWQSQLPVSELASLLLNLEFQGVIKALPGKKYSLA